MNVLADHRMWFGLHDSTDGFSRGGAWKRISCMRCAFFFLFFLVKSVNDVTHYEFGKTSLSRESDDDKWSNYSSIEMPRVKTMGLTYVYVCDM